MQVFIYTSTSLGLYSPQDTEDEKMPQKEHDIPRVGPPRLIAHKPEPRQTPRVEKVTYSRISILPTVPGNDSEGLSHFPTIIAAYGCYNIRGGEVTVNLFFSSSAGSKG